MPDPEDRDRWVREFRDRSAADLLEKYREPEALSELALNVLRDELKLRGLDPDSLQMTVPRASPEEKGDEIHGETEPPPDLDLPELRSETAVPSDLSTNLRVCPNCKTPNHPEDPVCRNCGAALGARSEGLEGFSEEGDTTGGGVAP